jgi:hypothetical protein
MYPSEILLQEVGRITIAGSRLEVQMGFLWYHLDKDGVDELSARKSSVSDQVKQILKLARVRLEGDLQAEVRRAADDARTVSELRNSVVHQDWVLRGPDAMTDAADLLDANDRGDLAQYLEEQERKIVMSPDWLTLPARDLNLVSAPHLMS